MTTTTQTTFRAGPWAFEPTTLEGHNFTGWIRQNGHVIAQVLHDRGTQFDGMKLVPERDAANGRLLAAAPDLLAALQSLENAATELGLWFHTPKPAAFTPALETARDAIAKATGS